MTSQFEIHMSIAAPLRSVGSSVWSRLCRRPRQTFLLLLFPLLVLAVYHAPLWIGALYGPLPRYVLAVSGGISDSCCAAANAHAKVTARLDSPIDIVLRPERAPRGPVFIQAFKLVRGEPTRLALWMASRSDGALHLRGLAGDVLELDSGFPATDEPLALVFAISRSPLLRSYESLQKEASGQTGQTTQLHRGLITVVAGPRAPRP